MQCQFTKKQTNCAHLLEESKHRLSVCHGQSMIWKQNLNAWKHFKHSPRSDNNRQLLLTWLLLTIINCDFNNRSNQLCLFKVRNNSTVFSAPFIVYYLKKIMEKVKYRMAELKTKENEKESIFWPKYLVYDAVFNCFIWTKILWTANVCFNLLR